MAQARKQLVVVTGMSGAGKATAMKTFEDLNFYCIDNLPPDLLQNVMELWKRTGVEADSLAVSVDVRAGRFFGDFLTEFGNMAGSPDNSFPRPRVVFLDAADAVLIRRFKETRRKHPLVNEERGIIDSIQEERRLLANVREHADKIIDTTNLEPEGLRREIRRYFGRGRSQEGLMVTVLSFGFKYGVPSDADVVFDVRFLVNPHYVDAIKNLNGNANEVASYVLTDPLTEPLLERLFDLVEFSIPQYVKEGKAYLTIAIGCTGGQHRSVVVANELAKFLRARDCNAVVVHRDLPEKDQEPEK